MARRPTVPLRSPGGPAPGDPDQRALDAIAAAVRRARDAEHGPAGPLTASEPVTDPGPLTASEPVTDPGPLTASEPVTDPGPLTASEPVTDPGPLTAATDPGPGSSTPPARPVGTPTPTATTLEAVAEAPSAWTADDLDLDAIPLFDDFALTAFPPSATGWPSAGAAGAGAAGAAGSTEGANSTSLGHPSAARAAPGPWTAVAGRGRRPALVASRHPVILAVMVVAVAVVVAGSLAAALALSSPRSTAPATGSGAAGGHHTTTPARIGSGGTGPGSSTPATAHGRTSTTPGRSPASTGAPGGAPHVSAVQPASGGSGQTVTVMGSGLYSGNGVITASVGGAPASTDCPSSTSCTVTVPNLGRPRKTTLVVATATGSSNSVPFDYT